jgi:hypothetical protein
MHDEEAPLSEHMAAKETLLAATRRVGDALPPFSKWLLVGTGAAFTLVLSNIGTVSKFIMITHIRFGLIVFLLSLAIAVLATYLATIVKAALASLDDGEALGKKIGTQKKRFDIALYVSEYQRGLIPPIRWFARAAMNNAKSGDIVAVARMIAKLSQVQALLVASQGILALLAIGALILGLKME